MFKKIIFACVIGLVGVNCVFGNGTNENSDKKTHTMVSPIWAFQPKGIEDVKARATNIVLAEVVDIYKGPDIVGDAPGEPDGKVHIPTERITLKVLKRLKGSEAGKMVIFRTGSNTFSLEGDPVYIIGETYMLFLEPREDGTYIVVSPEGRYRVNKKGSMEPMSSRGFASKLRNLTINEFTDKLLKPAK